MLLMTFPLPRAEAANACFTVLMMNEHDNHGS